MSPSLDVRNVKRIFEFLKLSLYLEKVPQKVDVLDRNLLKIIQAKTLVTKGSVRLSVNLWVNVFASGMWHQFLSTYS